MQFDLPDCALSHLRPVTSGKKWYWALILKTINIALVCSWMVHRMVSGKFIPQKDFRRHNGDILIRKSKLRVVTVDFCPTKAHKVADGVRYAELGHYPISCSFRKWTEILFIGKVTEIHVRSAYKAYNCIHFKTYFQIFHEKWQYHDIITTTCNMFII